MLEKGRFLTPMRGVGAVRLAPAQLAMPLGQVDAGGSGRISRSRFASFNIAMLR
ncbi:hypothetical protein [Roseovarius mucosus]|uniref:hypothetical protein n=1 Tax=Roseovarius mucosus TaxID=215743 RepID=UPI003CCB7F8E